MGHRKIRGIALISTFMFVGLLFMMAAAMVVTSRNRVFSGVSQHHQAQAFYLAESGLVRAMVALENDLDWPGVTDATIEGMPGTYTVEFGGGKYGSVKNIGKTGAADSYHGDETVPANTAVLIVQANVSGQQYVLEALVDGQGSIGYMSDAILSSGRIRAEGDFLIDGISALDDGSPVDGSIQSNLSSGDSLVTWTGSGDDKAHITGTVGSGASTSSSIDMGTAVIVGGQELNATHNIPTYDVVNEVASNSGGAPTWVDGGTTELTGGKHKVSADTVVNGNIVLKDGAEIYIDGDFQVNGSIEGHGAIWVTGDTSFKGDSSVTTGNNDESISLFVEGNVKLTGFDGTEFLKTMDDPNNLIAKTEQAVQVFQDEIKSATSRSDLVDPFNKAGPFLGLHLDNDDFAGQGPQVTWDYGLGDDGNVLGQLREQVEGLPAGESRDFVYERLRQFHHMFSSTDDLVGVDDPEDTDLYEDDFLLKFLDGGETHGIMDTIVGVGDDTTNVEQFKNLANTLNYDKPGTSYFQGAIYTKGYFYADNEVNVLGAIMVDGNGADEETFTRKIFDPNTMSLEDGPEITLKSGDVYLGNRTRVTYVEEFFTDDASDVSGPQNLAKTLWMGR